MESDKRDWSFGKVAVTMVGGRRKRRPRGRKWRRWDLVSRLDSESTLQRFICFVGEVVAMADEPDKKL